MSTMTDSRFTALLDEVARHAPAFCHRDRAEAACRELGWTLTGKKIVISETPSGGRLFEEDDQYGKGDGQWQSLYIRIAVIEPENFRHHLDLATAIWGKPSWYTGYGDLVVCWAVGDDTIRQLALDEDGTLTLRVHLAEAEADQNWWLWKTQYHYPDFVDDDDLVLLDENDLAETSADEYEMTFTWTGHEGRGNAHGPAEIWSVYTPRHLRGILTDALRDVHLAMRALGPGPDPLRVEFFPATAESDAHARLELSPDDIRLSVDLTDATRDYLTAHDAFDLDGDTAERRWPATPDYFRIAATATVVSLHHIGLAIPVPGEDDDDNEEVVTMTTSGNPLPLSDFDLAITIG
ncbi:hypothetical protein [Nocardia sp. NPDC057668]|uniref:hypothetical protein n=1 Tax=Nocardia sp. NPDC057668 TaxID=3346202 RepID=UPI00366E888A